MYLENVEVDIHANNYSKVVMIIEQDTQGPF